MTRDAYTRVVGDFAIASPIDVVCDGDAGVVAHSESAMGSYLKLTRSNSGGGPRIKKTRFGEIVAGLPLALHPPSGGIADPSRAPRGLRALAPQPAARGPRPAISGPTK